MFLSPPDPLDRINLARSGKAFVKSILTSLVGIICYTARSFLGLKQLLLITNLSSAWFIGHSYKGNKTCQICSAESIQ